MAETLSSGEVPIPVKVDPQTLVPLGAQLTKMQRLAWLEEASAIAEHLMRQHRTQAAQPQAGPPP